ncbi:MAG TPA: haloacid dehalogenase-like hydrolase [Polyangiaceae bacterium]|jgi:phosphoserine phosphatase|nr:haloacid dehalogenase-like hydrolase [Polyangiaceae bacterium]
MKAERVDAARVIALLEQARTTGPSGLAFDADGTLWAGDVGEDVFETACASGMLREDAREALTRVAVAHGLSTDGSPSEVAHRIFTAYRNGAVDELLTCEVMTFCYAGHTVDELVAFAHHALTERKLAERVRRVLEPVFAFAAKEKWRVVVVSASPQAIVAEALRIAGLDVAALKGARAAVGAVAIEPRLLGRVPYGPEKPVVGKELLAGHDWLGSFGDNGFDVEMLRAARVGVAVHPKAALRARLGELTNVVVLE